MQLRQLFDNPPDIFIKWCHFSGLGSSELSPESYRLSSFLELMSDFPLFCNEFDLFLHSNYVWCLPEVYCNTSSRFWNLAQMASCQRCWYLVVGPGLSRSVGCRFMFKNAVQFAIVISLVHEPLHKVLHKLDQSIAPCHTVSRRIHELAWLSFRHFVQREYRKYREEQHQ